MADKSVPCGLQKWSAEVAAEVLRKLIEGKGKPMDSERSSSTQSSDFVRPQG